jgi:hypothetical protein
MTENFTDDSSESGDELAGNELAGNELADEALADVSGVNEYDFSISLESKQPRRA